MTSFHRILKRYLLAQVSVIFLTAGFIVIFALTTDDIPDLSEAILADVAFYVLINGAGAYVIIKPLQGLLKNTQRLDNALRFTFTLPLKSAVWVAAIGIAFTAFVTLMEMSEKDVGSARFLVGQLAMAESHVIEATLYTYFMVDLTFFKIRQELFEAGARCEGMKYTKFGYKLLFALFAVSIFPLLKLTALTAQQGGVTKTAEFFAQGYALLFLVIFLMRNFHAPTDILVKFSQALKKGQFARRAPTISDDEFGALASAFNESAEGLEKREKIRDTFGKTVSPEVAERLIESGGALGGEEKRITILFSDIRSFTSLAEGMKPAELVDLLNRYFEFMARPIRQNGGVINKFIGDAILAIFGAPIEDPHHAESALRAGLGMVEALAEFNAALPADRRLAAGIGIHTGDVVAGTVGTADRMEYTVIGDSVNLASRLESLTKEYPAPLIVSLKTVEAVGDVDRFKFRSLGTTTVKGKRDPVEVFEPVVDAR